MPRRFNTAGPCLAEKHYMLPVEKRLGAIRELVAGEHYFVLHAARQSGKTTLIRNFARQLTAEGRHAALTVSLENFTSADVAVTLPQVISQIARDAEWPLPTELQPPDPAPFRDDPDACLTAFLAAWSHQLDRPLVVFFDEIDAMHGEALLSVLRQLRNGYCARPAPFPTCVALVGQRDVREYRAEGRPNPDGSGSPSPFNIKVGSFRLRDFTEAEVGELLGQHTAETGQRFEPAAVTEVFAQSQGQPWLVNALAAQLVTRWDALVPDRVAAVSRTHVLAAREILIERRDTHLDSLVARLNEPRVRRVIEPILTGDTTADATYDDDFAFVRDLGLVAVAGGMRRLANPIYQEIIPRVLTHQTQTAIPDEPKWYVAPDGTLDIPKLIAGFVEFWRRHGEALLRGAPYPEAAPHLVFMAYLQRIVNSGGHIDRELAVGTGRADLVVAYGGREDVIELKIQRSRHTLPDGLEQVSRYAKRLGRDVGYLVIFDRNDPTPFEDRGTVETVVHDGVAVTILRA